MYVKRLVLENFRSFSGTHVFDFLPGLNCIVGDNNCGKSSVFEAITWIISPTRDMSGIPCMEDRIAPVRVTMDIAGDDMPAVVGSEKYRKLKDYVFSDDEGVTVLRMQRSTEERTVKQSGKDVKLDVTKLSVWSATSSQYENPTGIDALLKKLLDFQPVWADMVPGDVADFGTTKILGKVIDAQVKGFSQTRTWKDFVDAHNKAFRGGGGGDSDADDDSLAKRMDDVAREISKIVKEQYGEATVRFDFSAPDASTLAKAGQLVVNDGAGPTDLSMKGTGMQRAFALALVQVLSRVTSSSDKEGASPPLILLIDEPETWLHPKAQLQLGVALRSLATRQQLFLITHSPYMLKCFDPATHRLMVLSRKGPNRHTRIEAEIGAITLGEPSLSEIGYRAFGVISNEFLDELYTLTERQATAWNNARSTPCKKGSQVTEFLKESGLPTRWS